MKDWPPKPGLTDMTRMRSTASSTYSSTSGGVPGLSTTPALQPRSLIMCTVRCRCVVDAASACTEMMSAPALAKSATRSSGSTIIRCTSNTLSVTGRSASTTRGPMVMLGTKRPSMVSMWIHSAPALSTAMTSAPRVAKLAERMLGDTMTEFLSHRSTLEVAHTRSVEARALPPALELPAIDRPARALRAKTAGVAAKADMFRCGGV
mmetsp:Transcript_21810/g.35300  ORF Transcript_21810/g.35300 Transcript_21810/m.35300 type:complete len:207 (-) Transcript_21810:17-637(-)